MAHKISLTALYFLFAVAIAIVSIVGCKKRETVVLSYQRDSIYDIDSNMYKTIKIGNQWWMAENLKVTHYRNGKQISGGSYWDTTVIEGAKCRYDNDTSAPGLLYNWYAVNDSNNIAPKGWHVATDDEWKELETFIGIKNAEVNALGWRGTDEGNALKAVEGFTGYAYSDVKRYTIWGNNKSGFSAIGGGCRLPNGKWSELGSKATAFWWTKTSNENTASKKACYRYLDYGKTSVFRGFESYCYGMSIRCVKDK